MLRAKINSTTNLSTFIAENGIDIADKAFYCWAIKRLYPDAKLDDAEEQFKLVSDCYDSTERFFHRGLGHPRSLFPSHVQQVYQKLLKTDFNAMEINDVINFIDEQYKNYQDKNSHAEAQEILSAYYHDVVHRNGKKPSILNQYTNTDTNGIRITTPNSIPITTVIIDDCHANLKVEELSCIVAESALRQLNIPEKYIASILLSIIATIPFDEHSHPDNLQVRLKKVLTHIGIAMTESDVLDAINQAVALSNRDLGSYGEDNLYEFDKKTWAMMYERNPALANQPNLLEESEAISKFYVSHKRLLEKLRNNQLRIYEYVDKHGNQAQELNKNAELLLERDTLLLGIQLGSLAILISILSKTNNPNISTSSAVQAQSLRTILSKLVRKEIFCQEIPADIVETLQRHNTTCHVNGIPITHGTENGCIALQLAKSIGIKSLLEIADQFSKIIHHGFDVTSQSFLALSQKISFLLQLPQPKHVILYFDLNGTIMVGDAAGGKSIDDSIWQMLCEDEKLKSKWNNDVPHEITFRDYIERHLCPGDPLDQALKKLRQSWYKKFYQFLQETNHPFAAEVKKRFEALRQQFNNGTIYRSFITLINYLKSENISFTLVLRTFGNDLEAVIEEIQKRTHLRLEFSAKFDNEKLITEHGQIFESGYDIYNTLKQYEFCAIKDDWKYWHQNGETLYFGKKFIFDRSNANITAIFFDDNIEKNILSAIPLGNVEVVAQAALQRKLSKSGMIVNAIPLDAASKDNYYVDLVKSATLLNDQKDKSAGISSLFHHDKSFNRNQSSVPETSAKHVTLLGNS